MQFYATEESTTFLRQCPQWHQQSALIALTQELRSDFKSDCPSFLDGSKNIPVNFLPSGIELQVSTKNQATAVLPVSNALVKTVTVNGVRTQFSNFNGLASVAIHPGHSTIKATVDVLWQRIVIISQLIAMIWGMLSLLSRRRWRQQKPPIDS